MVWDPSAGGFIEFSTRYIDPAMGFAMGWQFWFQTVITAPVEITAAVRCVLVSGSRNSHNFSVYCHLLLGQEREPQGHLHHRHVNRYHPRQSCGCQILW
jgi:amino acid permease